MKQQSLAISSISVMINVINLLQSVITRKSSIRACLWGTFKVGLVEVGEAIVSVGIIIQQVEVSALNKTKLSEHEHLPLSAS